jgi:hypothetical protein
MWRLLFYPDLFTPVAFLWQTIANLDIGIHVWRFLLLGLIPGTAVEISFIQLSGIFWLIVLLLLIKILPKYLNNSLNSFKISKKTDS